jgi:hypothetical protein
MGAGLAITVSSSALAQSTIKAPAFDVASVRPNVTGLNGGSLNRSGGKITVENFSLRECIAFAYGIATGRDYELSGGADVVEGLQRDSDYIYQTLLYHLHRVFGKDLALTPRRCTIVTEGA